MRIFLTGGAGYIGSHTYLHLVEAGHTVAIFDNFVNASPTVIERLEELSGKPVPLFNGDIRDKDDVGAALSAFKPDSVIHFAGLKSVSESVEKPFEYYATNMIGTYVLLKEMDDRNIKNIVFSSTAVVYGVTDDLPVTVDHALGPISPYGSTKAAAERLIQDVVAKGSDWSAVILRYFNPVGAHKSGMIGENPNGVPNNLMPYVSQVAVGLRPHVNVFGTDFETKDGTGVRDYIHVLDLASGHLAAVEALSAGEAKIYNLGTGVGYSVLDVVNGYSKACGKELPYQAQPRRAGDAAEYYSDPSKALNEMGWRAVHSLDEMCADSWKWQSLNPNGY